MAFNVSEFAAAGLPQGGARPSHFNGIINTPIGVPNIGARIAVTMKAASLPASTLSSIPVRYFGREVKFAGTRTFQPWQVSILVDEDYATRQALEIWSNLINRHEANLRDPALLNNAAYRTTATVTQYSKVGHPLRTYEFINIFPTEVGPIELNWDNGDAIEEFGVVFDYDYWKPVAPGVTGTYAV